MSQNTVLSCPFFSKFSWKTPCSHAHDWSKKRKFCQNYTLLWAKKVNRMPFFPISDEKITALMSIFCQKRLFSKNKTSTLLKTKCSRVIFSFFFYKNPILLCPYLVKKRIFCQNYTILWAIKVNKMPFFPRFFTKKSLLSYPIYIKNTAIL